MADLSLFETYLASGRLRSFIAVTPNDGVDLARPAGWLMVAVAGNVKVSLADGSSGVLPGLVPGVFYPGPFLRIWASGTTATGIVAGD